MYFEVHIYKAYMHACMRASPSKRSNGWLRVALEDGATGNDHVGSSACCHLHRALTQPAVHLDVERGEQRTNMRYLHIRYSKYVIVFDRENYMQTQHKTVSTTIIS